MSPPRCCEVVVGINISRGTPWYRRSREPGGGTESHGLVVVTGWFVVGGRRSAERLNRDWLQKQDLQHLGDDLTRLGERLKLFDDEPYVLCKRATWHAQMRCGSECQGEVLQPLRLERS